MSLENIDSLDPTPVLGDYQIVYHNQIHTGMKSLKILEQNTNDTSMKKSGTQTVAGSKTFSSSPNIPTVEWIDLQNANFESEGGWSLSSTKMFDTSQSHSGTRSYRFEGIGPTINDGLSIGFSVQKNETYYAEVWVKWENLTFSGTSTAISLGGTVSRTGGGSSSYPSFWNLNASDIPSTKADWIRLSGYLTIPDDDTVQTLFIRPSLRGTVTGGYAWFDDIRVAKIGDNSSTSMISRGHVDLWSDQYEHLLTPGVEVQLSNQDFETTGGWATSSTITYDSSRSFEGSRSLKILASAGANISEVQAVDYISVSPGEQYYAECYVWWEDIVHDTGAGISLQCNITNSSGTQIAVSHFKTVAATDVKENAKGWVKLFGTITMPANAAFLRMRCAIREGATAGTAWFDRVRVRKLINQTSLYYRGDKTWQTLNKSVAGLSNVDNTSDLGKPVSTAQQTAINTKQDLIPTGTTSQYYRGDKTWQTLNKTAAGLANVDNTSDANKPVSTAQQAALDLKQSSLGTGETFEYLRGDKTWQTLNPTSVGLSNANDTSDLGKPVSTAQQTALEEKADLSTTLLVSGIQTIDGVKTFSSPPRLTSSSTVGHVWKATSTDGSGSWQTVGTVITTVDWVNINNKPTTFAPTIGPNATDAAAGDHTHTKSSVGLGSVDNTSDLAKPVSTATQTALDAKVSTSRAVNTSSHFDNMGALSANRTLTISAGGIGVSDLNTAGKSEQICYIQTLGTREVGYGQVQDGFKFLEPMTITSVAYRMGTADGSGTTSCQLRKNGVAVSGTTANASTSPTAVTGSWSFAAGDILTVYISSIGTSPGQRLTADMLALKS